MRDRLCSKDVADLMEKRHDLLGMGKGYFERAISVRADSPIFFFA